MVFYLFFGVEAVRILACHDVARKLPINPDPSCDEVLGGISVEERRGEQSHVHHVDGGPPCVMPVLTRELREHGTAWV